MANVIRIFRKEVAGYVNSPSAYVFLITFLVLAPSLFFFAGNFFKEGIATMGGFFIFIPWLLLFFLPAVSMRVWAEEKRAGTEELLMTMPVRDWEVVLGKYLAALGLLLVALVLTLPVPLMISHFAEPKPPLDFGPIVAGYLASLLLGAAILAIGTWSSSLTVNQIIAFILALAIAGALLLIGYPVIYEQLSPAVGGALSQASLFTHYANMYKGVIDLRDIAYYLTVAAFFLFLNVRSVESRKWR